MQSPVTFRMAYVPSAILPVASFSETTALPHSPKSREFSGSQAVARASYSFVVFSLSFHMRSFAQSNTDSRNKFPRPTASLQNLNYLPVLHPVVSL